MQWRTIVPPRLSAAVGACGLSRGALLLVLIALHETLPAEADRFRGERDPDQPDSLFLFRVNVTDGALQHRLKFSVDDATAPGRLIVQNVAHEVRPMNP